MTNTDHSIIPSGDEVRKKELDRKFSHLYNAIDFLYAESGNVIARLQMKTLAQRIAAEFREELMNE